MKGEGNVRIAKKKMGINIHILGENKAILKRNRENTC